VCTRPAPPRSVACAPQSTYEELRLRYDLGPRGQSVE
jgi:hypothetical protein